MKKRVIIGIGVACLTAGIGLAGCGASNSTTETTTTVETTTTTTATTATTAATTTTTTEATTTTTTEAPTTTTTEVPTTTVETTTQENITSSVAQTIIEGNVIKSVVLNVEPPKVGEKVEITTNEGSGAIFQSYWPQVTYDDSCHIHMNPTMYYGSGSSGSACRWFEDYTDKIDFTYLFEGTIESGKSYVAGLIIYPEDGYVFSDDLKIFVNGAPADKILYVKSTPGEYEPAEADFEVKLQAE